jgi:hypothetical protein
MKHKTSQIWQHTPVILALGRQGQENHEFKASLSYIEKHIYVYIYESGAVAQAYNPSYLGFGDQEDLGLKPAGEKVSVTLRQPISQVLWFLARQKARLGGYQLGR